MSFKSPAKPILDLIRKENTKLGIVEGLHGNVFEPQEAPQRVGGAQWYFVQAVGHNPVSLMNNAAENDLIPSTVPSVNGVTSLSPYVVDPEAGSVLLYTGVVPTASQSDGNTTIPIKITAPGAAITLYVNNTRILARTSVLSTDILLKPNLNAIYIVLERTVLSNVIITVPGSLPIGFLPPAPRPPVWHDDEAAVYGFIGTNDMSGAVTLTWADSAFVGMWRVERTPYRKLGIILDSIYDDVNGEYTLTVEGLYQNISGTALVERDFVLGTIVSTTDVGPDTEVVVRSDLDLYEWENKLLFVADISAIIVDVEREDAIVPADGYFRFIDTSVKESVPYTYRLSAVHPLHPELHSAWSEPETLFTIDETPPGPITIDFLHGNAGEIIIGYNAPIDIDYAGVRAFKETFVDSDHTEIVELDSDIGRPGEHRIWGFMGQGPGLYWLRTFDWAGNIQAPEDGIWFWYVDFNPVLDQDDQDLVLAVGLVTPGLESYKFIVTTNGIPPVLEDLDAEPLYTSDPQVVHVIDGTEESPTIYVGVVGYENADGTGFRTEFVVLQWVIADDNSIKVEVYPTDSWGTNAIDKEAYKLVATGPQDNIALFYRIYRKGNAPSADIIEQRARWFVPFVNGRVEVAHRAALNATGAFTVMGWLLAGATGAGAHLVQKYLNWTVGEGSVTIWKSGGGSVTASIPSFSPTQGKIYHFAARYSGSSLAIRFYREDTDVTVEHSVATTGALDTTTNPLSIGNHFTGGFGLRGGALWDVRYYPGVALSDDEIAELRDAEIDDDTYGTPAVALSLGEADPEPDAFPSNGNTDGVVVGTARYVMRSYTQVPYAVPGRIIALVGPSGISGSDLHTLLSTTYGYAVTIVDESSPGHDFSGYDAIVYAWNGAGQAAMAAAIMASGKPCLWTMGHGSGLSGSGITAVPVVTAGFVQNVDRVIITEHAIETQTVTHPILLSPALGSATWAQEMDHSYFPGAAATFVGTVIANQLDHDRPWLIAIPEDTTLLDLSQSAAPHVMCAGLALGHNDPEFNLYISHSLEWMISGGPTLPVGPGYTRLPIAGYITDPLQTKIQVSKPGETQQPWVLETYAQIPGPKDGKITYLEIDGDAVPTGTFFISVDRLTNIPRVMAQRIDSDAASWRFAVSFGPEDVDTFVEPIFSDTEDNEFFGNQFGEWLSLGDDWRMTDPHQRLYVSGYMFRTTATTDTVQVASTRSQLIRARSFIRHNINHQVQGGCNPNGTIWLEVMGADPSVNACVWRLKRTSIGPFDNPAFYEDPDLVSGAANQTIFNRSTSPVSKIGIPVMTQLFDLSGNSLVDLSQNQMLLVSAVLSEIDSDVLSTIAQFEISDPIRFVIRPNPGSGNAGVSVGISAVALGGMLTVNINGSPGVVRIQVWLRLGASPVVNGVPDNTYLVYDDLLINNQFTQPVADGTWYVAARGIDSNGIPGPISQKSVVVTGGTGGHDDSFGIVQSVTVAPVTIPAPAHRVSVKYIASTTGPIPPTDERLVLEYQSDGSGWVEVYNLTGSSITSVSGLTTIEEDIFNTPCTLSPSNMLCAYRHYQYRVTLSKISNSSVISQQVVDQYDSTEIGP